GQKATTKDNPVQDEKLVEKKKIEGRKPEAGKTSGSKSATVDCVCVIRCPELPGATTFKELHGLWVHLIDDQGVVQCAMSRKGSLKDASDKSIKIKTSTTYGLFLSHQQETLSKSQIDEVKKFAIPVKGEVLSGKEAKIDIWSQGNFIICEPPLKTDAVKPFLAELPATYEVAYVGVNKTTNQRGIYSYPIESRRRKPERYRGGSVIPLVEWQTTAGKAYLTTKFHPESKRLKILLASAANPTDTYTSFNSLNSAGNHTFSGHHQYKGALVDALSLAATTKNPTKLPTPQSVCCLPGDIIWQTQGGTNHCGAYSFSAVMNYWHPELPENLGDEWAKRISSIVPFFNNAARVPGHLVEAASKNNLKCWLIDEDSVSTEAAALKTLKLWIQAGVPVIVLVNEAPGKFGLHWKTVVGYDQNRIFFNNSGGDMDHGRPITSAPDYFHAPVGNDVDSTEDFLMKWREASVPLVASKYTMLPMIPTALGYRGRESQ
ncbi:MAG TPA: hypothetical protein PK208_15975, partial [Fibrobacteria bacterium]|nr:hypothetical protein [Fibrobacteria bacterium]